MDAAPLVCREGKTREKLPVGPCAMPLSYNKGRERFGFCSRDCKASLRGSFPSGPLTCSLHMSPCLSILVLQGGKSQQV